MLRSTTLLWMTIHSPRAVPFSISGQEAKSLAVAQYNRNWMLGANADFLNMQPPVAEFIPFYLCHGRVRASFVGRAQYSTSHTNEKGQSSSSSHWVNTQLLELETTFHENKTQLYGGYKYNNRHIHHALRHDSNPLKMRKIVNVDMTLGSIGLFEMSTKTMRTLMSDLVKAQVIELATKKVREFHSSAQNIQIDFKSFDMEVDDVYPTFLPCHVIKANYDDQEYTLYVCGSSGTVGAPYLINALQAARLSTLATVALFTLFSVSKGAGFITGLLASLAVYPSVFYGSKYAPLWRRNYYRRQREAEKIKNQEVDQAGFKPSSGQSERITEEYHRSSYWDSHKYQQKKSSNSSNNHDANTGDASSDGGNSSRSGGAARFGRDPKGYYKTLGVSSDASVNEIRSSFRQHVIMHHPDAGGSTERMAALNEAYRTLRDVKLREAYDRS